MNQIHMVVEIATLIGTLVFAASGAMLGVRKGFDVLGITVLGCVTAIGGGTLRDTLTGALPVALLRDERSLIAAIVGSLLGIVAYRRLEYRQAELEVLDALGLATFTATAAQTGVRLGFGTLSVIFIGTLSGVGGGVIRDLLAREIPRIFLPEELYATTAGLGALVVYSLSPVLGGDAVVVIGIAMTFVARVTAWRYRLKLPIVDLAKSALQNSDRPRLEPEL